MFSSYLWINCLVFLLLWNFVAAQVPPRITEHPSDVAVAKNQPATLSCKATGKPQPAIHWYKDGYRVTPNQHRSLLAGDLVFLKVIHQRNHKPDVGRYYCEAVNPYGRAVSNNATLEIATLRENFRIHPSNQFAASGDTVTLHCVPPNGYPPPNVAWNRNGALLPMGGRYQIMGEGDLVIHDVRIDDAGTFQCFANNVVGTRKSESARLVIRAKPRILRKPQDATKLQAETVEFTCEVAGDPKPTIVWRKEAGHIPVGRAQITEMKSLRIERLVLADEGVYVCEGKNDVGSVEAAARLTIHSQPSFSTMPKDQTVGVRRSATFECRVSGNPPPAVFWQREGDQELMFPGQPTGRLFVTGLGDLQLKDVRKGDAGVYVCSALSVAGSSSAKAELKVVASDNRPPPIIRVGPTNLTLSVDGVAMLPCEASGHPKPEVTWQRDGVKVNNDQRIQILDSGTLQISDLRVRDSGLYTCHARSETGETSWAAKLLVTENFRPSEPQFPLDLVRQKLKEKAVEMKEAEVLSSTSIKINWQTRRGSLKYVEGFNIVYRATTFGEEAKVIKVKDNKAMTYILRDLEEFTTYEIRLQPFYFSVRGSSTDAFKAKTLEDAPSSPPRELSVRVDSLSAITITWTPPPEKDHNGELRGYKVYCLANETKFHVNITTNSSTHGIVLGNLVRGMAYRVEVAAFTRVGVGRKTTPVFVELTPEFMARVANVGSISDQIRQVVSEPWFIATIGTALWLALFIFSVWVCYKRRQRKKTQIPSVSVSSDGNPRQNGVLSDHHLPNLLDGTTKDHQSLHHQKLDAHNYYGAGANHMMNPNGVNLHIAPEYAEVGSNIPPGGIGNVSPNLKTFYCGSECSSGPYAVTNMVTTPNGIMRPPLPENLNNSDDSCRKTQIPYSSGIQSDLSGASDNNNRGSHVGAALHVNDQYILSGGDPCQWYGGSHHSGSGVSSTGSRHASEPHDGRYQQLKNPPPVSASGHRGGKAPLMNLGDMLPPPPEHPPPPTDAESAAESSPPGSPHMEHPSRVLGGTIGVAGSRGYPVPSSYQHGRGPPGTMMGFVPSPRTNPRSMTIPQQSDLNPPGPAPPVRHYKLVPIPNAGESPGGSPVPQTVYLTQQSLPGCPPTGTNPCCAQNAFDNGQYGHCGGQCGSEPGLAQPGYAARFNYRGLSNDALFS